jgi:hypothetical protein
LGATPPFIGRATPKLGRAPAAIPPTPFLRPNALILSSTSKLRAGGAVTGRVLAFAPMVNLEILKIS